MANILALGGEIIGSGGNCSASNVDFDNTGTGLSSVNVQDAIEEVNGKLTWGAWTAVSNFNKNNDKWTAPSNGFLQLGFAEVATDYYVYALSGGVNRACISNKGQSGGYTSTALIPVHKNEEFTLLTNQSSGIVARFMPIGF